MLMNPGRIVHNIQSLRGIAVLLVVLLHMRATELQYSPDQLLPDWLQFGVMGVDIFFVISGYIMVTVTRPQAYAWRDCLYFLASRAVRIYPAYWITTLLLLAALCWRTGSINTIDSAHVVKSLLLIPQDRFPLLFVGWTLVHEMFFYLVFSMLLIFPHRIRLIALMGWAIATYVGFQHWHPPAWEPWLVILVSPLSLEFIAGALLAASLPHLSLRGGSLWFAAGLVALAGSVVLWLFQGEAGPPGDLQRVIYSLPPAMLLALGCVKMEQQGQRLPGWLERTGDASYSIYLTHMLLLASVYKAWAWLPGREGLLDNVVAVPLMLATAILGGMFFSEHIEKPLLAFCKQRLNRLR